MAEKEIHQEYEFKDFAEAKRFVDKVAKIAEEVNHHPKIDWDYNKVTLGFFTHSAGRVTEKDENLASQVDALVQDRLPDVGDLPQEVKFFGDGGSRGNPGPAASGYVLLDMDDTILETGGEFMGITTNNQAEYHSLEMGLERALEAGVKRIHVFMDSQLAIRQISGQYKVKSPDLLPRYKNVKSMLSKFEEATCVHVPRELNKLADAEVNRILDSV
jgi:ribonuclease HI/pterin-4a-carbinolamine dehydratase